MTHTTLLNPYSEDELTRLEAISRTRPLSTLKSLINSVEANDYRTSFAIAVMNHRGEFTVDSLQFINITAEGAHYIPLNTRYLATEIAGVYIFKITEDEAKALKAAELLSGCLKTALLHLVNGLEDCE